MKKLFMILLMALSLQMCAPDVKLDYNVTKSENYKISERKMKKNSLQVKEAFEEDQNKFKDKVKELATKVIDEQIKSSYQTGEDAINIQVAKQMAVRMIEKGIEYQKSKVEEIKFFSDKEAQISQKVKVLDNSKIQKLQNEPMLFGLVAKKLNYKDVNEMISKMQEMNKNEAFSKIMNGIADVMDDEMKKEENYTQISSTVNMEKINGKWQIKDLNEQIKNIEIIFSNLSQAFKK
ncbi:hypothetical protein [Leptotrichia sp. oral taxon 847]|uniref:hypothetical protein n=1 Tax=Leptotrichia sp. oral taxon 847 TaxID=1785996 RepID=UPI0007681E95|nr:hypothetical protein [Leptotrichia sp. oral taxon 847]AMD95360.1 hypothetical protein AXF11_07095 [Leptotrichia sp. oral taxon 847]